MVPVIQSVIAGLTANYILGLKSGLHAMAVRKVWDLY